jgi:hypothetical protein
LNRLSRTLSVVSVLSRRKTRRDKGFISLHLRSYWNRPRKMLCYFMTWLQHCEPGPRKHGNRSPLPKRSEVNLERRVASEICLRYLARRTGPEERLRAVAFSLAAGSSTVFLPTGFPRVFFPLLACPHVGNQTEDSSDKHNLTSSNPNFGSQFAPQNMKNRKSLKSSAFSVHRGIRRINRAIGQGDDFTNP